MAPRPRRPGITPRRNGDGSLVYEVRWKQGGGRDGRRFSHTFTRERDAVEARARIQAAGWTCHCPKHAPAGVTPVTGFGAARPPAAGAPAGMPTFGEFADRHVTALTGVGPGYRTRFAREIERHFAPFLAVPLDQLTELDVREWIRGLETGEHPWLQRPVPGTEFDYEPGPLSPVTIRRLLAQAGAVMASAQAAGLAVGNPFRGHRLGRRDRDQHSEMVVLTAAEWRLLEEALPAGPWRSLGTLMVGTGLRFGEATALAVGAVDLEAVPPRLHVARAWQDDGAGGFQLGTPKSFRSRRTVTFTASVADALAPLVAGRELGEFVFTSPQGHPVRHGNFYHRVWRPAVARAQAAGLRKRPRIHDLRHTHVSWLIAAGVDVGAVSKRLGHESITTTVDRYHHLLPQVDAGALAALDQALPSRT